MNLDICWVGALGWWLAPLLFMLELRVRFPVSAVWKKQTCFFPIHLWNSVLWGASVTERWSARPQTSWVWISNPVSWGQCYLTHLFILRRFSWPNLACMCTQVHLDLIKGDKSVLMKRLKSETVPKPNVLLVDHMYGECQEQWQTLRTVARHASQVVKSTKVQLYLYHLCSIGIWRIKCQRSWASEKSWWGCCNISADTSRLLPHDSMSHSQQAPAKSTSLQF